MNIQPRRLCLRASYGAVLAVGAGFRENSRRTRKEIEPAMVVEQIERMKREYTDKYVVVDSTRPELARFRDVVGRVKTVNMNGRALVEFDEYHLNIGWYDIAPEFLKVVDKPPPKAPKPEAKKAPPAVKKPAAQAAPAAKPGKPLVADLLAAARGGKPAAAPPKPKPAPAAEKPPTPKVDRSKMSVADMLAAARANTAAGAAPAKPEAKVPVPTKPQAEAPPAQQEPSAAPATPPKEVKAIDKSTMSIADIVAWCREHDAK
jgi:hypothetical protein